MTASPLGRYTGDGDGSATHLVRLVGLPVRLLADGRERHDSLVREFALLALGPEATADTPQRLAALTEALGVRFARAQARPDGPVDRALAEGRATIDMEFQVGPGTAAAARQLADLMAEADEFCRAEQLLTLPRTPLQLRFDAWYLDEFGRQLAGEEPVAWDGPVDP